MSVVEARDVAQDFGLRFGRAAKVSRAPGRVNLIGEHTDYNDGFVMPAALDFATLAAFSPRADRGIRVYSMFMDQTLEFDLDKAAPTGRHDWSDYVFGVAAMLEESGLRLKGADIVVWSDVPLGAGLSSSAALEVSVAHALIAASGLPFEPVAAAKICQRAENDFVGMRCGIMDQYIAACEEGVRLLAPHLGPIAALRDVTPADLERWRGALPDLVYRRCRHVVAENARVLEAERALKAGDFAACGAAMNASQASMRDDFQITCPEIDFLADFAQGIAGVYGSRMTGGGFGGCTVSLVEKDAVETVSKLLLDAYRVAFGLTAEIFVCSPSDGAGFVDLEKD